VVEAISFRHIEDDHLVGFERSDTRTSLTMGSGNVVINVVWKLAVLAIYTGLYELTPLRLSSHNPLTWVALFFADDWPTTGSIAYRTRTACSGPATSSTTPADTTTSPRRYARPGCR
jgi:hypothetical protein